MLDYVARYKFSYVCMYVNLQMLNPKSFPNLQKLTYYRRKLDG